MNNAADRKEIRKAEKTSAIADRERGQFVSNLLDTTIGRRWMHDLLVTCHVFQNPFTSDSHMTAFGCGELNIGQRLFADVVTYSPDNYILMMREANERAAASERSRSKVGDGGDNRSGEGAVDGFEDHRDGEGNPRFDGYDLNGIDLIDHQDSHGRA